MPDIFKKIKNFIADNKITEIFPVSPGGSKFGALLFVFYPFIVYFSIKHFGVKYAAVILAVLFFGRFIGPNLKKTGFRSIASGLGPLVIVQSLIVLGVNSLSWFLNSDLYIRLLPGFLSFGAMTAFLHSLWQQRSMIENFARMINPDLPPEEVLYCRRVTMVWIFFLALNGFVLIYAAIYLSLKTWALLAGFWSYIFMGLLFVVEYIYRKIRFPLSQSE